MITLTLNGKQTAVEIQGDTPLLWLLRDRLGLLGTKYGCGVASCGACTVHINGRAAYSCVTPVSAVEGQHVTTIEGLSSNSDHPLQRAWIVEQVPQCGYCQSGQIMRAAALLASNKSPSHEQIVQEMEKNICRCGTYLRIFRAIQRAAREM